MAIEDYLHPVDDGTKLAGADLSALQYTYVKLDTAGKIIGAAAAGESCYGILQNKPTSGQTAVVRIFGGSKVVAGGALTVLPALLATTSTGKAKVASALVQATGAASFVMGHQLTTAAASGNLLTTFVNYAGIAPTSAA